MALYADLEPVIKQLTSVCLTDDAFGMGKQMGINYALEILAKAPLVEAEPVVHAHWVIRDSDEDSSLCECSACKEWHTFYGGEYLPKRCPECGAHMDEKLELRTCYCPLCDKHFKVRSNDSSGDCPDCGHHVVLREVEVEE
jgi:predicted RNA-binding Zn-ribbon protein involved in translation (DUF1610 family)